MPQQPSTPHRTAQCRGSRALSPRLTLALPVLVLLVPIAASAGAATLSLADPIVSVGTPDAAGSGTAVLKLRADGLPADRRVPPGQLQVKDMGAPSPPAVEVRFEVQELSANRPDAQQWSLLATVKGLPPKSTQLRRMSIHYPRGTSELSYILTNQYPAPFTWAVKQSPAQWLLPAAAEPLGIVQGPAIGVSIGYCNLIEKSTKALFPCNQLRLCVSPQQPCAKEMGLATGPNSVYLGLGDASVPAGDYQGTIQLTAREKPEGEAFTLEVFASSTCARLLGLLTILAGVTLGWAVNVFARGRLARDQALQPALQLQSTLAALRASLDAAPQPFANHVAATRGAIQGIDNDLALDRLVQNGLPPAVPSPFGSGGDLAKLKTYIESFNEGVAMLAVIVRDGMKKAWEQWTPGLDVPETNAIATAVDDMDGYYAATVPPSAVAAAQRVQQRLAQLANALHPPAMGVGAAGALPAQPAAVPTYQQVSLEIRRIGWAVWVLWLVLAGAAGWAVVILPNDGFGVAKDFLWCLFWGLGVTTAGQQISQLSVGSVSSALNITVLK